MANKPKQRAVLVTTAHRGVFFGYADKRSRQTADVRIRYTHEIEPRALFSDGIEDVSLEFTLAYEIHPGEREANGTPPSATEAVLIGMCCRLVKYRGVDSGHCFQPGAELSAIFCAMLRNSWSEADEVEFERQAIEAGRD